MSSKLKFLHVCNRNQIMWVVHLVCVVTKLNVEFVVKESSFGLETYVSPIEISGFCTDCPQKKWVFVI